MPLPLTVRNAEISDSDFAYQTREKTMRKYVEQTWGQWNEDEARHQIDEDIRLLRLNIIERNRKAVGMMRIDEHSTHLAIDQLFLLPEHQGQGIGTALIHRVLDRAKEMQVPVRLWVLRVNPAQSLYRRLGFFVCEETAASLQLQSAA